MQCGARGATPSPIAVRPATVEDVAAIQHVERTAGELFRSIADPRIARCADHPPMPGHELEHAAREGRAWVASDDGLVVGFAIATVVDGEGHLDEVAVMPSHGRRGVGTALLERVAQWTAASDLPSMTLTTFRDVPWNAPYYASRGFHVVDPLPPALQALVDEQATWGLDPTLRVVMRRPIRP